MTAAIADQRWFQSAINRVSEFNAEHRGPIAADIAAVSIRYQSRL